jgi:Fe-S cluster assembly protein SufD
MSVTTATNFLAGLLAGRPDLPAAPAWLGRLRAAAVDRVGALTVPTTRDEEWRFTDISPLFEGSFQPVHTRFALQATDIERFFLEEASTRLVFVDGVHAPEMSSPAAERGMVLASLAAPAPEHSAVIESNLGRHDDFRTSVFAALNTAFLHDGALVVVPRGARLAAPVHLLFVATQKDAVSYPRCLIVAEAGSEASIVEDFVTLQEGAYFTNAVAEIALADGASVNHIRVQRESGQAFHISSCSVSLGRGSLYQSVGVALGARISRVNLKVLQAGDGAECMIDGLALIGSSQLADTHTEIDHARPHGKSRQRHKCVVGGSAHAVFNGKIMVRAGAQQTDSSQSSRNLLLTGKAQVDTKPQLEIFADDVKCAHGATVGQLDAEEVFYLKSRGLTEAAARNLLTYAFGAEVIDRVPVASLRHRLAQTVLEQTTHRES